MEQSKSGSREISDLGARLKAERRGRGMTLKDLAERVGCSVSMLSKIENDQASPSLKTLHQITSALDTSIVRLFTEADGASVNLYRQGERPSVMLRRKINSPAISIERLSPTYSDTLLDANIHNLEPGADSGGDIQHEGEEIGYVLEGAAELTVDGQVYQLVQGDSFYFSSHLPHRYRNIHDGKTRILWVATPATF
ncbi:cupin domain-containing protein [Salipiger sp. P9]|uniref:cupin domain-containing protein n=1 Tax=Salipiger pentaromativorans TaxID=2943193 RepID=UPI0021587062|nr:cupin domain-containing protein [Salipiger pentaromativorans]MCR8547396.1 cupin domain-containing protein [Salipiger pentaromativorans]